MAKDLIFRKEKDSNLYYAESHDLYAKAIENFHKIPGTIRSTKEHIFVHYDSFPHFWSIVRDSVANANRGFKNRDYRLLILTQI